MSFGKDFGFILGVVGGFVVFKYRGFMNRLAFREIFFVVFGLRVLRVDT